MKTEFKDITLPCRGAIVVGVLKGGELTPTARLVDGRTGGAVKRALRSSRFTGDKNQQLEIVAPSGIAASRIVLAGLGQAGDIDALAMEAFGGKIVGLLNKSGESVACIAVDGIAGAKMRAADTAAHIAYGARLGGYRFDHYRTKEKPDRKPSLKTLTMMVAQAARARRAYTRLDNIADGVILTRNLVSEPANVIFPKSLAQHARGLSKLGVKVEVMGRARMDKLGMRALLGVAQGSSHEPQLVVMQWNGARRQGGKPIAFVGKGVTFDSGGISIKPSSGMEEMKWDMGGSAVVIGLMRALAARKARVNAVGVIGLVENLPSATAQRPGDVVKSLSGQTIEVINTDAEGRLVLADALWYTQNRFKPKAMIDLATLTGAIIVALGHSHAGLFSNDDELAARIMHAGLCEAEHVWRLPLHESYETDIDSDIADMKNVGAGRSAGSISAALFLQRFVNKTPWAHLDIAGTTWSKKATPTVPKGGTGFGVRLLDRLVAEHYEG